MENHGISYSGGAMPLPGRVGGERNKIYEK